MTSGDHVWEDLMMDYLITENKNKKIFYGSEVDNEFKCTNSKTNVLSDFYVKDGQICEFAGWFGDDTFQQKDKDFIIKDFRAYREKTNKHDSDKLLIKDYYKKEILGYKNKTYLTLYFKDKWFTKDKIDIVLEGVKQSDVKEWLKLAKNENDLIDDEDYQKLPIQIKQ